MAIGSNTVIGILQLKSHAIRESDVRDLDEVLKVPQQFKIHLMTPHVWFHFMLAV